MNAANYEAEAAMLGTVLVEGSRFSALEITEQHLQFDRYREIYRAMKKMHEQNLCIDLVTVTTMLVERISQIGGTGYLLQLTEAIASTESITHYERLVQEVYRNSKSSELVMNYCQHPSVEGLELLISQLQDFRLNGTAKKDKNTYDFLLELTEEMCASEPAASGYPTSYRDFDDMTAVFSRVI